MRRIWLHGTTSKTELRVTTLQSHHLRALGGRRTKRSVTVYCKSGGMTWFWRRGGRSWRRIGKLLDRFSDLLLILDFLPLGTNCQQCSLLRYGWITHIVSLSFLFQYGVRDSIQSFLNMGSNIISIMSFPISPPLSASVMFLFVFFWELSVACCFGVPWILNTLGCLLDYGVYI